VSPPETRHVNLKPLIGCPPIDLDLIFEKSSLKNLVGYTGSKNQVRTRPKIKLLQVDFSKINRGVCTEKKTGISKVNRLFRYFGV
jgi:hypothetical protein